MTVATKKAAAKPRKKAAPKPTYLVEATSDWAVHVKGDYASDCDLEDLYLALTGLRSNIGGSLKGLVIEEVDSYMKPGYVTHYISKGKK